MSVLRANRGCHEPQLEWIFREVLRQVPNGATMVELGASWAFYSMWFFRRVREASCVLVEPDPARLALGRRNFDLHFVDVLLADIQGAELDVLEGGDQTFSDGRVGDVFLGTHGQDLHYRCKEFLETACSWRGSDLSRDSRRSCCMREMAPQRFARTGPGPGGLPRVRIESPHVEGEMYFHGGQVMSWKPEGAEEVLFVSRQASWEAGRPIRGGVPVCFPWFGPHRSNSQAPAHGFVRTKPWELESIIERDEAVVVSMFTASDDESRGWWPASFRLVHRVTFARSLTMELIVTNTGDEPLRFEEALHTYYRVGQIHRTRVRGLEGLQYLDTLVRPWEMKTQDGAIEFTGETDRIYLDPRPSLVIEDEATRRVTLTTTQSHAAVVWNPWAAKAHLLQDLADDEWPSFVCVETCNVERRAVDLDPGRDHAMRLVVAVE